jgi:hypothetical protein
MCRVIVSLLVSCGSWAQTASQQVMISQQASSVFNPGQLSGLQVWYAADSGSNCGGACTDGASQTTWADKSSNANNASFSTGPCSAGTAPIYHTNQIGGKPAVTFVVTNSSCMGISAVNLQTASTIFAVARANSTGNTNPIISGGTNSYVLNLTRTTEQGATKSNIAVIGDGTTAADTSWHQINQTYNGTTLTMRLGSATDGSANPGIAITANENLIGADNGSAQKFGGQIAEIIVYNRVLNGTEIGEVEAYLNGRYGI